MKKLWKQHKSEFIIIAFGMIGIVFLLLALVYVFEYFNIHVPGSREMWIGVIGSILGGAFTLYGVMVTIYKQEESEKEEKRMQNMPILNFGSKLAETDTALLVVTIQSEVMSFQPFGYMSIGKCDALKISVANDKAVFNFRILDIFAEGYGVLPKRKDFYSLPLRLVNGDNVEIIIDCSIGNKNGREFCIVRFGYEDVLGNEYIQDVSLVIEFSGEIYYTAHLSEEKVMEYLNSMPIEEFKELFAIYTNQTIVIRDIKQPMLLNDMTVKLEESIKEFIDYKIS